MTNTFALNNNTIVAKKFDFNLICDLEDLGVSLQDIGKKPMAMVRAYVALCLGSDLEAAGKEMEAHMAGGNTFENIMEVMSKEIADSDFFRNLNNQPKTVAKKNTKAQSKTE